MEKTPLTLEVGTDNRPPPPLTLLPLYIPPLPPSSYPPPQSTFRSHPYFLYHSTIRLHQSCHRSKWIPNRHPCPYWRRYCLALRPCRVHRYPLQTFFPSHRFPPRLPCPVLLTPLMRPSQIPPLTPLSRPWSVVYQPPAVSRTPAVAQAPNVQPPYYRWP